jgi:hypothetical protein
MGFCKDPVTEEFNKRGYNLVKLPRVGIEPMDVLGRDGDSVEKLGSNALSVAAKNESGIAVDADVGALNGALSTNVKAQVGTSGSSEVTFIGTAKVTFAFKLFEVLFENGRWTPRGTATGDGLSFSVGDDEAEPGAAGAVLVPGGMLKVKL